MEPQSNIGAFPQGSPQPASSQFEQENPTTAPTQAPAQAAPEVDPQLNFPQDDPEMWELLGEQLDKQRNAEASASLSSIRPVVAAPSHYTRYVPPDPGGGWAAVFNRESWGKQIPVAEGQTDQDAIAEEDVKGQQPTGMLLARTFSQATFGATSHLLTGNFEKTMQDTLSSDELKSIELGAMGLNAVAWPGKTKLPGGEIETWGIPFHPVGVVVNKVFTGSRAYAVGKLMQSRLGSILMETKNTVPASAWVGRAFQTLKPAAEASVAKLEQAVKAVGGQFLEDGSLFAPKGAARGELKAAVDEIRQAMGGTQPIKIFSDVTKFPAVRKAAMAAMGVPAMAGAGAAASLGDVLSDALFGSRDISLGEAAKRVGKGAAFGAAMGVPFAIGEAIMGGVSHKLRGSSSPTSQVAPQKATAFLEQPVWNLMTQGPAPTGWKGRIIVK